MNLFLQRSTRTLLYSFVHQNGQLSACVRTKKTDASSAPLSTTQDDGAGIAQQHISNPLAKITLVQPNQTMTVTTFKEAQKLAKRRELHLVKQQDFDTKTQRAIYKYVIHRKKIVFQ